ncbi:type II secretion system F family protein [Sulfolobus acidocaldarius]|uniref:Flagella-related protein J n=4 Tax=Sulfolobus acidocaldarius TaxID=2285 RepID=Q4J9L1_SULAC|nr:type II secretion system F family protein [Sulfolobus acidocaldarius]AAY80519.1 flagella-related protein J [Sulfolobus acidocaldarius DSM 639]AGE71108.1 flagella-related protein J [Sulfolobus acidocaldarius N8]ALU28616.1 flagellar protein FlaJ [Sulfolobus acidocaldarius]ALU31331.1 flagellar protein FlaJ [Sulfolobus acidocaldarius]WCM35045.1 flagellar protein FlaJ [Sulfolobus acidocaldarius DSM 639]
MSVIFDRNKKEEMDSKYIFMLAFMMALFSAGLPPETVLLKVSNKDSFHPYLKVFRRIKNLVSGFRYKFSQGINYAIRNSKVKFLSEFLVRLSQAVTFGDDMVQFLEREIDFSLAEYSSHSARVIESMNNFLTVYATLNSSLAFLVADMTVLSVLYSGGSSILLQIFFLSTVILVNLTVIMYYIYKPESYMRYSSRDRLLLTALILLGIALNLTYTSFITMIITGVLYLGVGMRYRIFENKINNLERYFLLFTRYFTRNYSVVNNLKESLMAVLRGDLGSAKPMIRRALNRLNLGVNKSKIFSLMGRESKSVLVTMLSEILYETISNGGNMLITGEILSKIGDVVLNIRARKEQNGRAFEASIYALQVSSAGVSAALISITSMLNNLFSIGELASVIAFNPIDIGFVSKIFLIMLFVMSFANGMAISLAYGKSIYASLYFIGLLMIMSAISYYVILTLTAQLFQAFSSGGIISGIQNTT